MICKHCGTVLPDIARFCFICGKDVGNSDSEVQDNYQMNSAKENNDKAAAEAEEEAEKKAEEEVKKKAEEEAKKKAEEEAKKKAEEEAEDNKSQKEDSKASDEDEDEDEDSKPGAYKIMVNPDYVPPVVEEEKVLFEEHIDYQAIYRERTEKLEAIAVKFGGVAVVVIVIAVIGFFGFRFMRQKQWDSAYDEAKSMYEDGNYEGSITKTEELKTMYGADDNKIALLLADIYLAQGENGKAKAELLDVYNSTGDAELYKKYKSIGEDSSKDTDDEDASNDNDDESGDSQEDGQNSEASEEYVACLNAAQDLFSQEKYDEVIDKCKEAIKIDETIEDSYVLYAQACEKMGEYKKAIKILEIGIDTLNENGGKVVSGEYDKLLEGYKATMEGLEQYTQLFENMYVATEDFCTKGIFDGLDTIALSEDYSKAAAVTNVTYYVKGKGFVDSVDSGTALAVYNNEYFYFGSFEKGKRSGQGTHMGIGKDENGVVKYIFYKGIWSNDLPNGAGSITYVEGYGTDNRTTSITTGTFKDGYENGKMTRNKTVAGTKWGKLEYSCDNGVPQPLKDKNGKIIKNKDGLAVLGYHYFNNKPTYVVTIVEGTLYAVDGLGLSTTQ